LHISFYAVNLWLNILYGYVWHTVKWHWTLLINMKMSCHEENLSASETTRSHLM